MVGNGEGDSLELVKKSAFYISCVLSHIAALSRGMISARYMI